MGKGKFNWEGLIGDRVSLLLNNPKPDGKGLESYVGTVRGVSDDGFIFLETPYNNRIKMLIVKRELILSIWIYKKD